MNHTAKKSWKQMLGSSKESRNMQSLNFTTSWNRLALPVNPECQQPIKYFPVFTWNILGNRSAEAPTSRQLVWLNIAREREVGSSLKRRVEHVVPEFPTVGHSSRNSHPHRHSSRLQDYLSPFLLHAWSHSSAGRQPVSGHFLCQHKADQPLWAQVTFQETRTSWES